MKSKQFKNRIQLTDCGCWTNYSPSSSSSSPVHRCRSKSVCERATADSRRCDASCARDAIARTRTGRVRVRAPPRASGTWATPCAVRPSRGSAFCRRPKRIRSEWHRRRRRPIRRRRAASCCRSRSWFSPRRRTAGRRCTLRVFLFSKSIMP